MNKIVNILNKLVIKSSNISIINTIKRGRGVISNNNINNNQIILSDYPLAFWPNSNSNNSNSNSFESNNTHISSSNSSSNSSCGYCYKLNHISCSLCSNSLLINNIKQFHLYLLNNSLSIQYNFPNLIAKLAYKICLELREGYQNTYHILNFMTFPIMDETIQNNYINDYNILKDKLILFGYSNEVNQFLDLNWYCKVVGVLHLNSIRIPNISTSISGTALYDTISFINHSCEPNVALSFQDTKATLIAIKPIQSGEELFFNYIENDENLMNNEDKKLNYLIDAYGIDCKEACSCGKYNI